MDEFSSEATSKNGSRDFISDNSVCWVIKYGSYWWKTCDRALEAGFGNKRLGLDAVVCIYVHKTLVKSFYMAPTIQIWAYLTGYRI